MSRARNVRLLSVIQHVARGTPSIERLYLRSDAGNDLPLYGPTYCPDFLQLANAAPKQTSCLPLLRIQAFARSVQDSAKAAVETVKAIAPIKIR